MAARGIRRVAMLSAHTSPLDQPGTGDAGGMNVYVLELSRRLAARGIEVEVFTRATSRHLPPVVEADEGIRVHHVAAGPFEGLTKGDLPSQLCSFVRDVLRVEAWHEPGYFDLVHSHFWLSGQVGTVLRERWGVPLVHSMHTMAKVKNASLAAGDRPEPVGRVAGEEEIVRFADRLIANTAEERRELIDLYEADPRAVAVVHPGVDLDVFSASEPDDEPPLVVFAGRIQPLKAPDVVLHASALLDVPHRVAIIGGPSGSGLDRPTELTDLAHELGIADRVEFVPTVTQAELATWYSRAAVVCVPSYSESFGLVAIEAQACGTPVVAAAVGGLTTAVADGVTGTLVDGHDPAAYAAALRPYLADPEFRSDAGAKAVRHAESFGWDVTAERTLDVYAAALHDREAAREEAG
ncbi:D-inositol-3-phosphate glycosyltransferase [Aeromicrobium sp. Marseille-Q0843]|uniref:D-inositol-3-phosphate glycosyltransferase n=1 Tax=Aeromicrobium phoceense TaxID=2754045 RepID=A0A838XGS1_9ACTN|nr:D-inositol-3-phosphate glycosyltransferase [Aeromicrobium phoceense]MBA4607846.1 D-inositol-3-phosphate glycosyltransferase [Aeromicrobium phoceense]